MMLYRDFVTQYSVVWNASLVVQLQNGTEKPGQVCVIYVTIFLIIALVGTQNINFTVHKGLEC